MATPQSPQSKKHRHQHDRLAKGEHRRPWWESPRAAGGGALAIVMAIIVVVALLGRSGSTGTDTGPGTSGATLPAAVLAAVTNPAPSLFEAVGRGGQPGYLTKLPEAAAVADSQGKPLIVYVGAEYCPFCASERWSLAMALARFGTLGSLRESSSSASDVFPSTNTLSFHGSTFISQWISFDPVEMEDRDHKPLESPSAQVAQIFNAYDQPPYTAAARGFPFLDVGGRFVLSQASFSPQLLQGKTWEEIAAALANPSDPITQAVVGNANAITASICIATGNQPAAVCSSSAVTPIIQTLSVEIPPTTIPAPSP